MMESASNIGAESSGAIVVKNTLAFDRQRAGAFKQAIVDAVAFAREHAPQLMTQVCIDEEQALCYSFQVFRDSDAMLRHWRISDRAITAVMEHCTLQSIEVYGDPTDAVRRGISDSIGHARLQFFPEFAGFYRAC